MTFRIVRSGRIALLVVAVAGLPLLGCSSYKVYKLPDGRSVLAIRDLNEVYPTFAATFKAEADLAYSQKDDLVKATAKGEFEQKVTKLYQDLDAITYQVRTALATGYSTFVTSLGSAVTAEERKRAFDQWDGVQKQILELTVRLRGINEQIALAKNAVSNTEYDKLATLSENTRTLADQLGQYLKK